MRLVCLAAILSGLSGCNAAKSEAAPDGDAGQVAVNEGRGSQDISRAAHILARQWTVVDYVRCQNALLEVGSVAERSGQQDIADGAVNLTNLGAEVLPLVDNSPGRIMTRAAIESNSAVYNRMAPQQKEIVIGDCVRQMVAALEASRG